MSMRILYIGAGYVGACSAAVTADSGHDVLVYDTDEKKIGMLSSGDHAKIEARLFEKGLADILTRNKDRIAFTADYGAVRHFLDKCDAIFLCLPTPELGESGESDLCFFNAAVEKLAQAMARRNRGRQSKYIVVVIKSTVPIAAADATVKIFAKAGAVNFGVAGNPEFLVAGKAVGDSLKPSRVVIGAWHERDFKIMRKVYQRFYDSASVQYIEVNPKEAAAGKLLANYYLYNKLMQCFDAAGRVSESFSDIKFENLKKILTGDQRLGAGDWGFYNSLYCGGSCFIKDSRSLAHQLRAAGQNTALIDSVDKANKRQLKIFLARAEKEAGFNWQGKSVAILGLAFKRDTNDARHSPAAEIIKFLRSKVKKFFLYDPAAMPNFQSLYPREPKAIYASSELAAVGRAEALIIATDWPVFHGLADYLLAQKKHPLIMDGRRLLQNRYDDLQRAGFNIIAVGSPFFKAI
ncbi:UDP-glucose/GDP-mannose dehydrogenase family protein [Patescibacteria group bacterium]|nr:MAG: UDP-glucose/GDP-mannose dehydrogenase family protein [Patescibacteria group bacterium]